jgi:hypothetical protein
MLIFYLLLNEILPRLTREFNSTHAFRWKSEKTFGKIKDGCIFALPTTKKAFKNCRNGKGRTKKGRLAQLVQSTCLTSRGSLVRTQYLPPKKAFQETERLFLLPGV